MTTLIAPEELEVAPLPRDLPRLRLGRAGRLERTIDLSDGKWSIGSSPRCQVRLPAGESQPLQCLLSLSDGSAEVTRWAAGVLLNGREFARQTLEAGDRLTIGDWELEWQPPSSARGPRPELVSPPGAAEPQGAPQREAVDDLPPAETANAAEASPIDVPPPSNRPAPLADVTLESLPESAFAPAQPTETPATPEPAASPAPTQARPAAKTVLLSSRLTDPFNGLLGPASPTVAAPSAPESLFDASAAAFEDRVVLDLWQGRYAARQRTRLLVQAMRAVQGRVSELGAAIAEIQEELACASARASAEAADRAADVARLESELAAADADRQQVAAELEAVRNARPRTAPPDPRLQILADELTEAQREIAELRNQLVAQEDELESIRTQAEAAEADRHAEAEQFAAAQEASRIRDEQAAAERAAWEQQRAAAEADADRLRDQLYACEMQVEELRQQVEEADAARAAVAEALATSQEAERVGQETIAAERTEWEQRQAEAAADADRLREQLCACELQIAELRDRVTEAEAARAAAAEQLATEQDAVRVGEAEKVAEREAWEIQRAAAAAEADQLREHLDGCGLQIEQLRRQLTEADGARAAVTRQFEAAQEQQSQWLAECRTLEDNHALALAEVTAERDGLRHQLEQLAAELSQRDPLPAVAAPAAAGGEWSIPTEATAEDAPSTSDLSQESWGVEATDDPSGDAIRESSRATTCDGVPQVAAACLSPSRQDECKSAPVSEPATEQSWPQPEDESPSEPLAAEEQPAEPDLPTSFIDKYRHLLEEGGDAEPSPRLSRPTLDDEYQSTRASSQASPGEEDTDEALEAYMSNLMRRVRGDGSSSAIAAANAAVRLMEALPDAIVLEPPAPTAPDPEIEVDANGMLRLARRQPMSTDLAAMRELANNSARTAIARHRQRRRAELALSKGAICLLASGASAYLLMTASSAHSFWFWSGCATLVMAAITGVQLVVHGWQRWRDGRARRRADRFFQDERGSATAPAAEDIGATS